MRRNKSGLASKSGMSGRTARKPTPNASIFWR